MARIGLLKPTVLVFASLAEVYTINIHDADGVSVFLVFANKFKLHLRVLLRIFRVRHEFGFLLSIRERL